MKVTSFEEIGKKKASALFLVNAKEEDVLAFVRVLFHKWPLKMASLKEVLDDIGLFAEEKIFLITDAEKLRKEEVELFHSVKAPLFFVGKGLRANFPIYAWVEEQGVLLDLAFEKKPEKEKRFLDLIVMLFASFQKKIARDAASRLLSQIGEDAYLLEQEVSKLVAFSADRPQITIEDVTKISSYTKEESIWDFLDALLQKQKDRALSIGKKLIGDGESIFPLLKQIRTQLQTDFQVALLLKNPDQIQARFPYMKGWVLEQHMNTARKFGLAGFKKALLVTEEVDLLSRGVVEDPEFLIELLIAKL